MAFLKLYIEKYDSAVFSAPAFARKLSIPQVLIFSIDPLSDKKGIASGSDKFRVGSLRYRQNSLP